MGWFKRKRADADNNGFFDDPGYHQAWERKELPGPGAMAYAWETLGLAPLTPIGRGIVAYLAVRAVGPQVYMPFKSITVVGIPTMAGQMALQPLYDPETGYGPSPLHDLNPYPASPKFGNNDPT